MGRALDAIKELLQRVSKLTALLEEVNTSRLRNAMYGRVERCFKSLRPLREDEVVARRVGNRLLCVGDWMTLKSIRGKSVTVAHGQILVDVARRYGAEISDLVNDEVREPFRRLVELAWQLRDYKDLNLVKVVDKPVEIVSISRSAITSTKVVVVAIHINTAEPYNVTLKYIDNAGYERLTSMYVDVACKSLETMPYVEELIDDIADLALRAQRRLSKIKAVNDEVLKKMEETVMPWLISAVISGAEL